MRISTAIITGLGLACLYLYRARPDEPSPRARPHVREARPAARIAPTEGEPAIGRLHGPGAVEEPVAPARESRESRELHETREEAEHARVAFLRELDARLGDEPGDPAWRPERALEAALGGIAGAHPRETRCTATFCRVTITRDATLPARDLAMSIIARADSPYAAGTVFDDGEHESTLYVLRPGHRFEKGTP